MTPGLSRPGWQRGLPLLFWPGAWVLASGAPVPLAPPSLGEMASLPPMESGAGLAFAQGPRTWQPPTDRLWAPQPCLAGLPFSPGLWRRPLHSRLSLGSALAREDAGSTLQREYLLQTRAPRARAPSPGGRYAAHLLCCRERGRERGSATHLPPTGPPPPPLVLSLSPTP